MNERSQNGPDTGIKAADPIIPGLQPVFATSLGWLYEGDCLVILPRLPAKCIDTVFADPPFNLGKKYGRRVNDRRAECEYLDWCRAWLDECCRVVKPGGAIFVYSLPKWGFQLAAHLEGLGMHFHHWIAVSNKSRKYILGRLYPAHYALLYFTKGAPGTFQRILTPIETCRHCRKEIKDYGGHREAMNPNGVNLTDMWTDIAPVRHGKFKSPGRRANALSTRILDRVVEMTTCPGDLVLDPFGGSGTTYAVCERKGRRWIGIEIESVEPIVDRLSGRCELHDHRNPDRVEGDPPIASGRPRSGPSPSTL
jgi:site-specific DNA-methyltransferase (adenine-specific)